MPTSETETKSARSIDTELFPDDEPARAVVGATASGGHDTGNGEEFAAMRNAMSRALQKPKREQTQTVILRVPSDLLKAIDEAKGEASRNHFFVELARLYVKSLDK